MSDPVVLPDAVAPAGPVAAPTPAGAPVPGVATPIGPAPDAALPFDATRADPALVDQALALYHAGGPVVAILAAMSVVALTIVLVKLWQFALARVGAHGHARRALALHRAGRGREALGLLSGARNPAAQVLALAIRGRLSPGLDEALVREEVTRAALERLETLRAWFRPLEVIATLAPLLGLFGTVLGMIAAFRQMEAAGSRVDPSVLSGGIWEALLTTAVGLAVAIPVVAVLNWLERRVDRLGHVMENLVTQVFTIDLSAEPPAVQAPDMTRDRAHEPARLRAAATGS